MCLAPIADMYNHSGDASVHFEADDEVCDECGSLGTCPHNDDPLPSEAYGRPSAFLPAQSGPNSQDWIPPIELQGVDTVDMVAQQDLGAKEEAYNTYGNFSNANLLTTYGFSLEYETEWERYVWEWRNKEEKQELLSAMGILTTQRRRAAQHSSSGEQDRIAEWVKTCMAFTNLPQSNFAELLSDSYPLPQSKMDDPSITITVPVLSPFVVLTQSATQRGVDTELEAALEDVIAPLSTHDGSKDSYQPLFVESLGKISLSLWRAILLYSISTASPGDDLWQQATRIQSTVKNVETLFGKVVASNDTSSSQSIGDVDSRTLLHSSLTVLVKLVSHRLKALKAASADDGDKLSVLEVS